MALSAAATTQVRSLLADCEIGDHVVAEDVPAWSGRRVHQEFLPPGHGQGLPAWLFAPLSQGSTFIGWKRID